ncbi:DUF7948 domain-containing protein [Lacrimispora aerotolerans]|uniref:DUF7948 domain-containing protein n=1 Tax=Lacrimispora aerotolerans TaxID=36832 RepID=UPI00047DB354|nr:SBBP repeat-containing protein [Lacrimispora aerotolerans]
MQNIMADPLPLNKIKLPLSFVANNGQEDSRAHFTTNLNKRRIFFSSDRITLVELEAIEESIPESDDFPAPITESDEPRNGVALELSFTNANAGLAPEGMSQLPGHHHFYRGNDSTKWNNGVPHYKELRYPGVWNGVDLELSGSKDGLKMNWLLDTPDRISSIRLHWAGADSLELDSTGKLLVHHALGTLTDLAPIAYQEIEGERKPVDCVYRLYGSFELGFELTGTYLENLPLIIDPILPYATYLGGSLTNQSRGIAVDTQGCAHVVGDTTSIDFPVTPGAFQTTNAGVSDVFITKFSSDGSSLIYSTYLGGSGTDLGYAIALDTQGCPYVTGQTNSANFPITPGAFQTTAGGIFVTKLAADGESLIYSTFLGNSGGLGYGIAVDSQGCSYVTGQGGTIPTTPGAFQTTLTAPVGAVGFITKFSNDGSDLIYSTYLYGNGNGYCMGIALDAYDYAYVTGITNATNFPVTPGAFQTTLTSNAVTVTKLAIDGSSLAYSTFLSGNASDVARSIAVDSQGCAYVTGRTASADFPVTPNAFQTTYGGGSDDVFLTKLSPGGNSLIGSTFLGGDLHDDGFGVALDEYGHAYVTGHTSSQNFPTTPNVISSALKGTYDAFICILSSDLTNLIVSYYLGGNGGETGQGIALGPQGAVYTAGSTSSADFPVTPGAYQATLNGTSDAYVTRTAFAFYRQASVDVTGYL